MSSGAVAAPSCAPRNATAAGATASRLDVTSPASTPAAAVVDCTTAPMAVPKPSAAGVLRPSSASRRALPSPTRLANAARQHADAERQQREAADQAPERLAPVLRLDAQVVGFAALVAVGDAELGAAEADVGGQPRDHRSGAARQHLELCLAGEHAQRGVVVGPAVARRSRRSRVASPRARPGRSPACAARPRRVRARRVRLRARRRRTGARGRRRRAAAVAIHTSRCARAGGRGFPQPWACTARSAATNLLNGTGVAPTPREHVAEPGGQRRRGA